MRITILTTEGMFASGLTVVLDILAAANALRTDVAASVGSFDVSVVSATGSVHTGHGLDVPTSRLDEHTDVPDLFMLPAVGLKSAQEVVDIVRGHPALSRIAAISDAGTAMAAACSGTFFLAEAGVLDGRSATTSWWLGPAFRHRYPRVLLDESRTLAQDGNITTAGAAFAHIDLALSIVHRESPALADLVARYLVIGERPSQALYAVPTMLAKNDPTITAFERCVREHLTEPLQVGAVATIIGVSERTLQRTTSAVLGMSPSEFIHDIRLEQATFLLRTTNKTIDAVAAAVGYRNGGSLRAAVRRRRGTTIGGLRHGGGRTCTPDVG